MRSVHTRQETDWTEYKHLNYQEKWELPLYCWVSFWVSHVNKLIMEHSGEILGKSGVSKMIQHVKNYSHSYYREGVVLHRNCTLAFLKLQEDVFKSSNLYDNLSAHL